MTATGTVGAEETTGAEGGRDTGADDAAPRPADSTESGSSTGVVTGDECRDVTDCPGIQQCIDGYCTCQPTNHYCWYYDDYECGPNMGDNEGCPPGQICAHGSYASWCIDDPEPPPCEGLGELMLHLLPESIDADSDVVALAFVDADGDPSLDLVVATTEGAAVHLADGVTPPVALPVPEGAGPTSVAGGNFDGDALGDVAVGLGDDGLVVLRGDGSGSFEAMTVALPSLPPASSVAATAFNTDGIDDLAVSGTDGVTLLFGGVGGIGGSLQLTTTPSAWVTGTVQSAYGRAVAAVLEAAPLDSGAYAWAGSPDGDAQVDNSIIGQDRTHALVSQGWSEAGYMLAAVRELPAGSRVEVDSGASQDLPFLVSASLSADLDGGGVEDLVVGGEDTLRVFFSEEESLECWADSTVPGPVAALAAGDFTGDGRPDLAIASGSVVSLYENAAVVDATR